MSSGLRNWVLLIVIVLLITTGATANQPVYDYHVSLSQPIECNVSNDTVTTTLGMDSLIYPDDPDGPPGTRVDIYIQEGKDEMRFEVYFDFKNTTTAQRVYDPYRVLSDPTAAYPLHRPYRILTGQDAPDLTGETVFHPHRVEAYGGTSIPAENVTVTVHHFPTNYTQTYNFTIAATSSQFREYQSGGVGMDVSIEYTGTRSSDIGTKCL